MLLLPAAEVQGCQYSAAANTAASAAAAGSCRMEVEQASVGQYLVEAHVHQVDLSLSPLHQSVHI
jgi:hypothetical protein